MGQLQLGNYNVLKIVAHLKMDRVGKGQVFIFLHSLRCDQEQGGSQVAPLFFDKQKLGGVVFVILIIK